MTKASKPRGRRGDGSIYQTADGRWRAGYSVPDPLTGRPVRRCLSGRDGADVRAKLKAARAAQVPKTPTIASYSTTWLARVRQRVRPATVYVYESQVRSHIVPAVGRIELARLTPADVEGMTGTMLQRGLKASTVALARNVLVVMLSAAERDGLVMRNVARLAIAPRQEAAPPRALSAADRRRLEAAAAVDDEVGPLALLALATGLRRGELCALRWEDVRADELTVTATMARSLNGGYERGQPKTRRSRRVVGLPSMARAALDRQRVLAAGSPWVFPDHVTGRPMHPERVTDAWRRLARSAGIDARLHDLRHTAATLTLAAGVPVRDVADSLGHASPSITLNVYGHAVPEGRRRVADALDKALSDAR